MYSTAEPVSRKLSTCLKNQGLNQRPEQKKIKFCLIFFLLKIKQFYIALIISEKKEKQKKKDRERKEERKKERKK